MKITSVKKRNGLLKKQTAADSAVALAFDYEPSCGGFGLSGSSQEQIQALYTLVRKQGSLSDKSRSDLMWQIGDCLDIACNLVEAQSESRDKASPQTLLPLEFYDFFGLHMYLLFSSMSSLESSFKLNSRATCGKDSETHSDNSAQNRAMKVMSHCAEVMQKYSSKFWKLGVADEEYVSIPTRISYQVLENVQRPKSMKQCSLDVVKATIKGGNNMSTVVAALMDLMHNFEHVSPLVAEMCGEMKETSLAEEMLRDISNLNCDGSKASINSTKNVSGFIPEIAKRKPEVARKYIALLIGLLDREPHQLRSNILVALGILAGAKEEQEEDAHDDENSDGDEGGGNDDGEGSKNEESSEGGVCPPKNYAKTIESLLDVLTERAHDTSSFTRTAVLKTWGSLISSGNLPLDRVCPVAMLAIDRLQDKTVMVRRNALQMLTTCLEMNPFGSLLDPAPYAEKLEELTQWHVDNEPASHKAARNVARLQKEVEEAEEKEEEEGREASESTLEQRRQEMEAAIAKVEAAEEEEQQDTEENQKKAEERSSKLEAREFASEAIRFINSLESANKALESMLLSKNTSDVVEALRFYVRAKQFQLPCAITGMRNALALMWSSEKQIRTEVLKAFIDVFIGQPGCEGKKLLDSKQIAHNLIVLCGESSISEQCSIEEAIASLVKSETIPSEVFMILWSVATKASGLARSAALLNIAFGASADPNLVDSSSRLRHLLVAGYGESVEEAKDWKAVRAAGIALQKIGRVQQSAEEGSAKALCISDLLESCCCIVRGDWLNDENEAETNAWFSASEASMDAIFSMATAPDQYAAELVKGMAAVTFEEGAGPANDANSGGVLAGGGLLASAPTKHRQSPLRLARFFFVTGHLALKLLLYTESITKELKKANNSRTVHRQEAADMMRAKKGKKGGGSKSAQEEEEEDEDDAIEAELGVAQEAEALTEKMMDDIAEKEIVGRGLLGVFGPLIVRVVANESGAFSNELLQTCAVMALAKFMSISNAFCEKNLPLLLTTLGKNKSADTTLRANCVIALGDLAFRFPNTFEPYTSHLYSNLRDASSTVKRHSMGVLTHLILNDMIKIKGNVASVARLIVSDDQSLSDMSKLLFNELSKRSNNPVYNLIPDVVSLLSSDADVSRADFKAIMTFLLSFMQKDKFSDSLVDKLIKRFETAASINVRRDLALCVSLLKVTEKSCKVLNEEFKLYKDSLFDAEIFGHFATVIKRGRSFASPSMKQILEELEQKLNEENSSGVSDIKAAAKADKSKARAERRAQNKEARKKLLVEKKRDMQRIAEEDDEDFVEFNPEESDKSKKKSVFGAGNENSGGTLGNVGAGAGGSRSGRSSRSRRAYGR